MREWLGEYANALLATLGMYVGCVVLEGIGVVPWSLDLIAGAVCLVVLIAYPTG